MTYLTFKKVPGGYEIWFLDNKIGLLAGEADGHHYFLYTGGGGLLPDYILREIVEKMEELNKEEQ
ncbi:MAG: hypothetical protein ACRDE7_00100 [Sphingobacterium sp.]